MTKKSKSKKGHNSEKKKNAFMSKPDEQAKGCSSP